MTSPLPFKAKGDRPEWRIIFEELLDGADFNTIITYEQLDDVLGRPFVDNRSPLYRARQHLGEMQSRWIEAQPGVGYRVIEANEHMDAAHQRKRRAKRQLGLMVKIAEVTDLSRLKPEELAKFDSQAKINAALYMVAVHHERRLNRIEEILRSEGKL